MSKNVNISIVMPAFNSEKYINEAIDSVLAQSYQHWELIVVDDASTDSSFKLAEYYKDSRIRVIRNNENVGVAGSRNRGAREAKWDWIAFLDSDDLWRADKLEKQINQIEDIPNGKLFFTGSGFINENGDHLNYELHVPEKITREEVLKQNLISCSSVVIKKELFLRYPMPDIRNIHEDFAVWLKILQEEPFAYGLDEPLLTYRLHNTSKSGNKLKSAMMQWKTYRVSGESLISSIINLTSYTLRGLKKYENLQ